MWLFHVSLCVVIAFASSECPSSIFEDIHGTCYYFSSDRGERHTWQEARQFCQDIGALLDVKVDLAELDTEASCMSDGLMMQKIAGKGERVWLGGTDEGSEGAWYWNSGRSISIMDSLWYYTEPSSGTVQNCLIAWVRGDYNRAYYGDNECSAEDAFVCMIL
ncbi:unnamed protein product [Meganyctiphanes norvegica]|uniref:C-type lectin domain-containing protein n=1 Tax=Meganyctiphanes norvegica TaxID=48144 RepID=A0AAV2Q424_MEGNR